MKLILFACFLALSQPCAHTCPEPLVCRHLSSPPSLLAVEAFFQIIAGMTLYDALSRWRDTVDCESDFIAGVGLRLDPCNFFELMLKIFDLHPYRLSPSPRLCLWGSGKLFRGILFLSLLLVDVQELGLQFHVDLEQCQARERLSRKGVSEWDLNALT